MSRPSLVESIFAHALAKNDPAERSESLDQACGADHALRLQVQRLLDAHTEAEEFLTRPADDRPEFDAPDLDAIGSEAALTQPEGRTLPTPPISRPARRAMGRPRSTCRGAHRSATSATT